MAKQERKLPEVLEHDFVVTDESVNRKNWRLLVSGIDLVGFLLNPVCCVQHNTYMIPVGKWKNLRIENNVLKGTVEFDPYDEMAVTLYWKYKDGYMNAVSLHIVPIEESSEPSLLLPGQKYPTVTKSEMLEISLVTIPGQKNAVNIKLSTPDGEDYKLSLLTNTSKTMNKEEKTVEQLQAELKVEKQLNADNLIKLHKQRGVLQDGEIEPLKKLAMTDYESVSRMLDARQPADTSAGKQEADPREVLADALVKLHFDRGAISDPEKSVYKLSAISDYEATRKILEAKQGKQDVQSFVQGMGNQESTAGNDERSKWTYLDYYKKDMRALHLMEKNEPEKYKKLVADFQDESISMGIGSKE